MASNRSKETQESATPAIVTQGLVKRFGRIIALNDVNLVVPLGTTLGLLGPNGSGKTTLLSILAGFIAPTGGSFRMLGESSHRRALARTGSLISRPLLWSHLSCRDNLRCLQGLVDRDSDPHKVEQLLEEVGLAGEAARRKFGQCSTGMKQRLGLAAALLGNPDLLLLDEPTTGLDPEGMVEIRQLIRQLGKSGGRTIIMSSHLLHEVELTCDHYAIIYRGNLVDQGPLASPPTAAFLQMDTTDNPRALLHLSGKGWDTSPRNGIGPDQNGFSVLTVPGREWEAARDLSEVGIFPVSMSAASPEASNGSLEARYLAAVGRETVGREPTVMEAPR